MRWRTSPDKSWPPTASKPAALRWAWTARGKAGPGPAVRLALPVGRRPPWARQRGLRGHRPSVTVTRVSALPLRGAAGPGGRRIDSSRSRGTINSGRGEGDPAVHADADRVIFPRLML